MYCIVGEKILRCEVSEKLENYSWVRIGRSEKGQTVPNNRVFETEEAALLFLKKRSKTRSSIDQELSNEINACKKLYTNFFKETGINVRVIDRLFRVQDVEKQLAHLRKKYDKSDSSKTGDKTPTDSRAFSKKPSNQFKTQKVYSDVKSSDDRSKGNRSSDRSKAGSNSNRPSDRSKSGSNDYRSSDRSKAGSNDNRSSDRSKTGSNSSRPSDKSKAASNDYRSSDRSKTASNGNRSSDRFKSNPNGSRSSESSNSNRSTSRSNTNKSTHGGNASNSRKQAPSHKATGYKKQSNR